VTLHLAPVSPLEGEMSAFADRGGYAAFRRGGHLQLRPVTPLCRLRRHLPLKGGEGRVRRSPAFFPEGVGYLRPCFAMRILSHQLEAKPPFYRNQVPHPPVSPLEGEMSAFADRGGYAAFRRGGHLQLRPVTPLCRLRRHLPLKGGEGRVRRRVALNQGLAGRRRLDLDVRAISGQPTGGAWTMPHREVSRSLRRNAKTLRRNITKAEIKLWRVLRGHRLENISFRRQMPIAGYVADFAAPGHKLIIELDGSQHGEKRGLSADLERERVLAELGWTVLRFWNAEVTEDLDGVCRKIMEACGLEDRA